MNNKIFELAKQADLIQWDTLPSGARTPDHESVAKAMKFAELIIQEYEQFLPEICPWSKADEKGPMKGWHVQFVARKHFGME